MRISEPTTHREVGYFSIPEAAVVTSIAWSGDSLFLAILTQKERVRYDRFPDFLLPLFGHGIPRSDLTLAVYSVKSRRFLDVPLRRGVPFVVAAYVQWDRSVSH